MGKKLSICCAGDLILDEPGPMEPYFAGSREVLKAQDVLADIGFDIATVAGSHLYDCRRQ